jgi:predicted  nucleic acid-binding Zn-ribbon protein
LLSIALTATSLTAQNSQPASEEVIGKIKTALAPLFQENQDYIFSDLKTESSSGGFKVSGNATFFQMNSVTLVATFASTDVMARFELQFPTGSKLPTDVQHKLAKQNIVNWMPGDIQKVVSLKSLYLELAQNTIITIGIQFAAQQDWNPVTGIAAKNIVVDFNLNNPLGTVSVSSTLKSDFMIGDASIKVGAILSSNPNDCVLTGNISNLSLGNVLSTIGMTKAPEWPDAFWNLSMSKGSISIAPFAKTLSLNATSDFGQVEFFINASKTPVEFMVGVSPPSDFSFKRLDQNLGVLDNVGLKNTAIVLASSTQKTRLSLFKKLGQEAEVTRGLTLLSLYDISATSKELEKLIGKSQLLLRATISNNPAELKLMASLDASIPLDAKSNVILKNVNFAIAPNPASFTISLGGMMDVKTAKETLSFTTNIAVNITNLELSVEGIMKGTWDRPFDTNGVQLIDLGIGVGVSFKTTPIPMPTLQFKGKIKVGNPASPAFAGDVTFALDPSNPTQCMIDAGFNQILLSDLVKVVQYSNPSFKVPEDSRKTVNSIAVTDARLTIVPGITTVTVLEKLYDPGFLIKGKSTIDGYQTNLLVGISAAGIKAGAGITSIVFPPYFSFTGALGKPDPYFNLVLSTTDPKSSKIAYSGKATLLKLTAESDMMLSDVGFDLYMNGKIFDKFQAKLRVAAGSTKDGAGYNVMATMDSDLQKYISDIASAEIDKATKDSQKAFKEAQTTLTQKQKEVATLDAEIEKQRGIVKSERDKDCKKFEEASAQVSKDRKKVNGLKDDIDDKEDKIKKLKKQMDDDITKIPENGAKITKLKAEIVGLEAAKVTANGVLATSKKVLEALGTGCDQTPIDLDPRIAGLITSRETADKSLQAAKVIVGGAGSITGGSLKATKYIVEKGGTGVVTITYAYFESKLSIADGGMLTMKVKGTYAGDPLDKSFTINLPSPQATVEAFARELLK